MQIWCKHWGTKNQHTGSSSNSNLDNLKVLFFSILHPIFSRLVHAPRFMLTHISKDRERATHFGLHLQPSNPPSHLLRYIIILLYQIHLYCTQPKSHHHHNPKLLHLGIDTLTCNHHLLQFHSFHFKKLQNFKLLGNQVTWNSNNYI